MQKKKPTFTHERRMLKRFPYVAGVDEAGVGPLAGPVVAAAVMLDERKISRARAGNWWKEVADSKQLTAEKRESLMFLIVNNARSFGIGSATAAEIDSMNILQARLLAMKRAIAAMKMFPRMVFVDGTAAIPDLPIEQQCVVRGDQKILSVACASIIAKVTRDNILKLLHQQFPEYGFDQNKGYPTRQHTDRLKQFGPCVQHRRSFAPVRAVLNDAGISYDSWETPASSVLVSG